jgi:alkylated DNA repair protein (DNA oxidative demethylase)
MADLFENVEPLRSSRESMAEGAVVLHGTALAFDDALLAALQGITAQAPFRHMVTPGGLHDVSLDDQLRRGGLGHR